MTFSIQDITIVRTLFNLLRSQPLILNYHMCFLFKLKLEENGEKRNVDEPDSHNKLGHV